jgi:phage protein D
VEDNRGNIEDYSNRYGYGEKEAEAMYRLKQARNLFKEIYDAEAEAEAQAQAQAALAAALGVTAEGALEQAAGTVGYPKIYAAIFQLSNVTPHFDALEYLIVKRSLDRQYPEGWGRRRQEGEGPE